VLGVFPIGEKDPFWLKGKIFLNLFPNSGGWLALM